MRRTESLEKNPDAGKDWGQEETGMTEDEMVGWHHQLHRHAFGSWWWTGRPGVLWFMGSQRVGHNWETELNWTEMLLWACLVAKLGKNLPAMQETPVQFLGRENPPEKRQASQSRILGLSGGSDGKEPACNVGVLGLIPALGRSPVGGHGNLLKYSCLENPHGQRSLTDGSPWGCEK